jgi:hypothetical protein
MVMMLLVAIYKDPFAKTIFNCEPRLDDNATKFFVAYTKEK